MIAIRTLLTLTLLLGVGYPLLVTGLAQILFPWQANGSQLFKADGTVIGSVLLAQPFSGEAYFMSRPSASNFASLGGSASNQGMSSPLRREFALQQYQQGVQDIALLTRSASGLDPHLPLSAVQEQVERVAKARNMSPQQLHSIIRSRQESGILGPSVINVLELNVLLDKDHHAG
ncbi:MAG: potassium-transporting ATPase subunit C [Plesiomonas sp.]